MTYFNSLENATGIVDVFMDRQEKYKYALTLAQEMLREQSHLPTLDRELIAAYTSYLNSCEYCFGSHKEFAISLGANEDDLSIFTFEKNSNHRLGPILDYVRVLTLSPSLLTQEDKDLVIEAGFTEEELKDAIAVSALFNFYNRIVEGHGIEPNENYEESTARINSHGYDKRY